MEKLKDYFTRYPASQEVFENGGQLFHNRGAADSYGSGETKKYTRKDIEQLTDNSDQLADKGKKVPSAEELALKAEETKQAAIETLKGIADFNVADYNDLFKIFKALDLKADNNRKPAIVEALIAEQTKLKAE